MTQAGDEMQILQLDDAWNEAYRQGDRAGLADILADDFTALDPAGRTVTRAALMVNPPPARSVAFSERSMHVFGDTAISRGRIQLELDDRCVDQRFLRVYARRDGTWRAISVSVAPVTA